MVEVQSIFNSDVNNIFIKGEILEKRIRMIPSPNVYFSADYNANNAPTFGGSPDNLKLIPTGTTLIELLTSPTYGYIIDIDLLLIFLYNGEMLPFNIPLIDFITTMPTCKGFDENNKAVNSGITPSFPPDNGVNQSGRGMLKFESDSALVALYVELSFGIPAGSPPRTITPASMYPQIGSVLLSSQIVVRAHKQLLPLDPDTFDHID